MALFVVSATHDLASRFARLNGYGDGDIRRVRTAPDLEKGPVNVLWVVSTPPEGLWSEVIARAHELGIRVRTAFFNERVVP